VTAPAIIGLALLCFAGTHLVLGQPPVRERLVRRMGEPRFLILFTAVAAITFGSLTAALAWIGGDGPAGPALGREPAARAVLSTLAFLGFALAMAGIVNYGRAPMTILKTRIHPASGIERVTRHPFFVGFGLFAAMHALLAPTMAVCVFFAGVALLSVVGVVAQDRKLIGRHGAAYADYVAATSVVPFAALLRGRQAFGRDDSMIRMVVLPLGITGAFLLTHAFWSAHNGAVFAAFVLVGGALATLRRLLKRGHPATK
jgi:uncharacterized membrane protein